MRVAWDMQAVTGPKPTGLGVAAAHMQRAVEEHAPQVEVIALRPNLRNRPLRGVKDRLAWEQLRLPNALANEADLGRIDVFFSPALGVPLRCPVPKVAYVHDLIQLHYPRQYNGVAGWYWKSLLPQTWRSCDALVVSNETVAADLQRFLGFPRGRIFIAPFPLNPVYSNLAAEVKPEATNAPYFVCVGTLEPRKNIEQAIEALSIMAAKPQFSDVQLHVIGQGTAHEPALRGLASQRGVERSVQFLTHYLPTEAVVARLLGATALVSMSRYEGFGLPPLEAMSIGCPVIIADTPVYRAVYDDPARRVEGSSPDFVRLDRPAELAEVMERLLTDHRWRASQAETGQKYAATFTGAACAQGLIEAFEAVVN
jgi:glycosyltransferase involved in cell wall biosynthesis